MSSQTFRTASLEIVKALILSVLFTLALVLLFALLLQWCGIPSAAIAPVNQGIKGVSLLVACLIAFGSRQGGWKKGLCVGLLYVIVAWVVFSALSGKFSMDAGFALDLATGAVMGLLSGAISVSVGAKRAV